MHEITRAAIAAVGPDQPSDWELRPANHIAALHDPVAAAPLLQLLKHPDLAPIVPGLRLTCPRCGARHPSRYYFADPGDAESICSECAQKQVREAR